MTESLITVPASRLAATLDIARSAVRHAAEYRHTDVFALTGENEFLFHGRLIPQDIL